MISAFLLLLAASPLPDKGEPPLTAQTQISGGARPAEQTAVSFDHADLSFELLPRQRRIRGDATLSFTARASLFRLVIDLDRNLPVSAISIDGIALPKSAWRNIRLRAIHRSFMRGFITTQDHGARSCAFVESKCCMIIARIGTSRLKTCKS